MTWWRHQNLEGPIADAAGRNWHFLVWHGTVDGDFTERIFFWDDSRSETGVFEARGDQALHVRRIRDRMRKLTKDPEFRSRFLVPLRFPLERHHG